MKEFTPTKDIASTQLPPQNTEAEQAVLGIVMMDREGLDAIVDALAPEDFYRRAHQLIYQAALDLYEKREAVDLVSLTSRLQEKKQLEEVGGATYLSSLINTLAPPSHLESYSHIVRQKKILRDMIQASYEISQLGFHEEENVEDLLDKAEQKIFKIAQRSINKNFSSVADEIEDAFARIENLQKNNRAISGVATGFDKLDNLLSGLHRSDLVILAARPSLGKTSLALDIARNAALKENVAVGIFSLEMSKEQIIDRFISAQARIDLWKLHTGKLSSEGEYNDFARFRDALSELANAPIFINDMAGLNIMEIRAMARRLQAERKDLGLIIVDYLQLIQARTKSDNMVQQITEISRALKGLAKELNVPVLALSQLSRAIEQRGGRPKLSDLRESGSIEQDADVVMFIYREDRTKEISDRPNMADIIIAKHRNGPIGQAELYFKESFATFENPASDYETPEVAEM